MPNNRNYFTGDPLAYFEKRVRHIGVWCDVSVKDKLSHKFVSRNPKANIAISLCGTYVVPIEKLHENTVSQKCLVCDLYDTKSEDGKEALYNTLDKIVNEVETKQEDLNPKPKLF
jgi:hypothetical protein